MKEVTADQRAEAPWSQTGLIVVAYADGTYGVATCAIVGRNDVITATHVLFDPLSAGWGTIVAIYFGADYNSTTNAFDTGDMSYALSGGFTYTVKAYPTQVFSEGDNGSLTEKEIAYDVAMIGLSVPVGDTIGWLGVDPGFDYSSQGTQIGYPAGTTGMQTGDIGYSLAKPAPGLNVYESFTFGNMGPGSSGGPLLQGNYVIGVKSAGSNLAGYWADIGNVYGDLVAFITSDDYMMAAPGQSTQVVGTAAWDTITTSAGNDNVGAGAGTDAVWYHGIKSEYTITYSNGVIDVTDKVAARDGHDTLTGVERIQFADYGVAFDIDGDAGQAYRLYKAAFDRAPDLPGLGYQMNALDQGYSLAQVATAFIASPEFQAKYGNVDDTQFITLLYANVLDRAPDAGGLQFHLDEIHVYGLSRAQVLCNFSESPENKANVIGLIAGGMTFEF